jgi:hypothetical protein
MKNQPPSRHVFRWLSVLLFLAAASCGILWWRSSKPTPAASVAAPQVPPGVVLANAVTGATDEIIQCLLDHEPGLDLTKVSQRFLRDKMAKHYPGLASRMRESCIPAIEGIAKTLQKDPSLSEQAAADLEAYKNKVATLAKTSGEFVSGSQAREAEDRTLGAIEKAATDWDAAPLPEAPSAFEHFFACGVPGLGKIKDGDDLFRFFGNKCIEGDARAFMAEVQTNCGDTLSGGQPKRAVPKEDLNAVRRYRRAGLVKLLWSGCVKDTRKVLMAQDGIAPVIEALLELRAVAKRLGVLAVVPAVKAQP